MRTDTAERVLATCRRILEKVEAGVFYEPETIEWAKRMVRGNASCSSARALLVDRCVQLAIRFTRANDEGDDASGQYDEAETDEERSAAAAISDQADAVYNQSKRDLFEVCRTLAAVHHEAPEPNGNETNPASSEKTCGCTLCRDWRMRRDTLAALERLRPDQVAPRVIGDD